jgi:plasmid maintenance system antidote protein VapI
MAKKHHSRYVQQRPLHDWMERTKTKGVTLAERVGISQPHLSKILHRKRRCTEETVLRLSEVTGVPVENILRWMVRSS